MKRINNIFYFLPALLFVIAFTSCSKDSDDVSGSELVQTLQKNKWILKTAELNEYGDSELELRRDYYAIYFTSDNEGFTLTTTKIIDTEGTDGYNRDFSHFTYTVSGNSVRLTYSGSGTRSLTYSGGNLVNGDLVYVPYKLNSSDVAVIEEGKYAGDYDFEYSIGFEDDFPYYRTYYSDGEYHYIIPMSFGVPKNTLKRGITSFGISLYCTNGTINNSVKKYTGDAYVYSERVHGESTKCFSGTINSNDSHDWETTVSVSSKSKSIKLKYDVVMTTRDGKTITGDYFQEQTFNYSDGNDDEGNDDDGGSGSQGGSAYSQCPNNNHPHAIDLGLPSGTKWACCNVGANKPDGYGNYYAWGETQTKSNYNWSTYKYGSSSTNVQNIGNDIAGTQYDAATANWGAPWRMPTLTQIKELLDKCSYEEATMNGVEGLRITGLNGGTVFLPAAGWRESSYLYRANSWAVYWSSTLGESSPYYLDFDSGLAGCYDYAYDRFLGLSVRPVRQN